MKTEQLLKVMYVVSWIIFVGLCVKVGAIIISVIVSLFYTSEASKNIYMGLDLSNLYAFDLFHYVAIALLKIAVPFAKALIFYKVIRLFGTLNIHHPYSPKVSRLLDGISYLTLFTGLIAVVGNSYSKWLSKFHDLIDLNLGSGTELLFMAGVLFTVSLIFKRGLEIQSENELTI